jgi:hypothetical protein
MSFTVGFPWRALLSRSNRRYPDRTSRARARWRSILHGPDVLEDRWMLSLTPVVLDGVQCVYDNNAVDVTGDAKKGAKGICWLADADLAKSNALGGQGMTFGVSGINPDGSMTWETAVNWVSAMNSANYLGHNNWSLPGTLPIDNTNPAISLKGPEGDSFGFDCAASPLGELFYTEFGGSPGDSFATLPDTSNTSRFKNFQSYYYWSGTGAGTGKPARTLPADFSFGSGFLGTDLDIDFEFAIPEFSCDASLKSVDPSNLPNPLPANHPNANDIVQPPSVILPPPPPTMTVNPDGTIHDAALNINLLPYANLAAQTQFGGKDMTFKVAQGWNPDPKVINIYPDGLMNVDTAVAWINAMNRADYLGHNNWRLPDSPDAGVQGYYRTNTEMGQLYYTELGGQAGSTILLANSRYDTLFQNIEPYYYWSGSPTNGKGETSPSRETFSFGSGYRSDNTQYNLMYVIPVYDGPQMVTNITDSGPGSLRDVISNAHPGDTIVFDPSLAGTTILLQSPITITMPLDIEGLGADKLTISGQGATNLFIVGPYVAGTTVQGRTTTTIAGLTLDHGIAVQGGAILNNGVSLTLNSDRFTNDHALSTVAGTSATGGAVAVLANDSVGTAITVTSCQFKNDEAFAGVGTAENAEGGALSLDAGTSTELSFSVTGSSFAGDSARGGSEASFGGNSAGGAVWLSASGAQKPSFTFTSDAFTDCSADGGSGADAISHSGAAGGHGDGGAIYYRDGSSFEPSLTVQASSFTSNFAGGGDGGAGAAGDNSFGLGGNGGAGGNGVGAAIEAIFANSAKSAVTLQTDVFSSNSAGGGNGGNGGPGKATIRNGGNSSGGAGGSGGQALGGAIAVTVEGSPTSAKLLVAQCQVKANTAQAGNGGAGGGGPFGPGGEGAAASGGGLFLSSFGGPSQDTWVLRGDVIQGNIAASGNGGRGTSSPFGASGGGGSMDSSGGGVFDGFDGTLRLLGCNITNNTVADGKAGAAGGRGGAGGKSHGSGGGLYIVKKATAVEDGGTHIRNNNADHGRDVYGHIGTIRKR